MPYVTVAMMDAVGINSASLIRVEDEQEANDYVYDLVCTLSEGNTGAILDLFGGWLDTMKLSCTCGADCPRSVAFMLNGGEALFTYYETSPFIF